MCSRRLEAEMSSPTSLCIFVLLSSLLAAARAEDPYRFYTWNITFGDVYPLGVKQQVRTPAARARIALFFFLLPALFLG